MPRKIIISKFGGTSVGNPLALRKSAALSAKTGSSVIIVSATSGTTNLIERLAKTVLQGNLDLSSNLVQEIIKKHQGMSEELEVDDRTKKVMESIYIELETLAKGMTLLKECSKKAMDGLYAIGERLSSTLFAAVLKQESSKLMVQLLDIRNVLKTDSCYGKARPLLDEIKKNAQEKLLNEINNGTCFVTQGFIGQTLSGDTTTLGRGGSDYSASLLAESLNAEVLEIWTDVAGIATTDPRLLNNAKIISEITYQEASELATFGAKILHPTTLAPAIRENIPVFVGSSQEPEKGGTWIKKQTENSPLIRAITVKKDQAILTLRNPVMVNAYGFLAQIFSVFETHRISIDTITTSEISVAMTVDLITLENKKLFTDLQKLGSVEVEKNLSLISLVGNNINHTPGLGQGVFNALQGDSFCPEKINVRLFCLGASKNHFCFLVQESYSKKAIEKLHNAFIDGVNHAN